MMLSRTVVRAAHVRVSFAVRSKQPRQTRGVGRQASATSVEHNRARLLAGGSVVRNRLLKMSASRFRSLELPLELPWVRLSRYYSESYIVVSVTINGYGESKLTQRKRGFRGWGSVTCRASKNEKGALSVLTIMLCFFCNDDVPKNRGKGEESEDEIEYDEDGLYIGTYSNFWSDPSGKWVWGVTAAKSAE
eukprot:1186346-Prorocentrum_minimum.AAC.2